VFAVRPVYGQVTPQMLPTSPMQIPSQLALQQYGSEAQTAAAQGSQVGVSGSPESHGPWAQSQPVLHSCSAWATHDEVQLVEQQLEVALQTATTQGSASHRVMASSWQGTFQAGLSSLEQQLGCCWQTCATQGSRQASADNAPSLAQTVWGQLGQTPQSSAQVAQSSPSQISSPHTHSPQSPGQNAQLCPSHCPLPQQPVWHCSSAAVMHWLSQPPSQQ